jgi:hypothetical protein
VTFCHTLLRGTSSCQHRKKEPKNRIGPRVNCELLTKSVNGFQLRVDDETDHERAVGSSSVGSLPNADD